MILALQFALPPASLPNPPAGLAPRRSRPVTVPPLPEYAAILASPIFAPDRRPGPAASPADLEGPLEGQGLAGYAALGVATGRGAAVAIVSTPGGGVKSLHPGDAVEGWRLVAVGRTAVTFERQGARRALAVGAPAMEAPAPDAVTTQAHP